MIIEALVNVFMFVVDFLLGLLPNWSPVELTDFVTPILDSAERVWPLIAWLDLYAPVGDFLTIVTLGTTLYVASLVVNGVVWVTSKLHITGGGSD